MLFFRGPLTRLERRLGYRFRRREYLERALTHRSYANERDLEHNYERLEFLGDSVLGAVVAEWLFARHPEVSEGALSGRKSLLVSEKSLARWAEAVDLGSHLRLGVGEERSGGRRKRSILADSMEAVIGAAFVDGGLRAAKRIVEPLLEEGPLAVAERDLRDPKTRLQELTQAREWNLPEYRSLAERGPDHAKEFVVECRVGDRVHGRGSGRTKKAAEKEAARSVLRQLTADPG